MKSFDSLSIKELGEIPLYVALNRDIRLAEFIDSLIPKNDKLLLSHGTTAELLVINRATAPTPLYHVEKWAEEYKIDALYNINASWLNDDKCARSLTAIAKHAQLIFVYAASKLYHKLEKLEASRKKQERIEVVNKSTANKSYITAHLDSTNLAFYGAYENSDFVTKGYSNDHFIDLKQIRVQLMALRNSLPMFYMTTGGNSVDKNALQAVLTQFINISGQLDDTDVFNLKRMNLVIDRGYLTVKNAFWLDNKGIHFTGMLPDLDSVKRVILSIDDKEFALCSYGADQGKEYRTAERKIKFTYEGGDKTFRVIIVWSAEKEQNDLKMIDEQIKKYSEQLEELKRKLNYHRYKRVEYVKKYAKQILNRLSRKYKGLIDVQVGGEDGDVELTWSVSQEKLAELKKLAGKYALLTNWSADELSGDDAIKEYKSRGRGVEWVFKQLKHEIRVRPIYLHDEERIGALVMLTMIALLEFIYIYNRLKDIPRKGSFSRWLKYQFSGIGYIDIEVGGRRIEGFSKLKPHQVELFGRLGLEPPPPFA